MRSLPTQDRARFGVEFEVSRSTTLKSERGLRPHYRKVANREKVVTMKYLWFFAVASGLLWTTLLAAQERPKSKGEEDQVRDAAVLEAVLVDLLTQPDSPVEPRKEANKEIHFSTEALRNGVKGAEVLRMQDKKILEKLPTDQLAKAREAAEHLAQRVEKKEFFKDFVPKDKRIFLYVKDAAAKDKEESRLRGPQIFRAYSPGYSKDQELAVVRLSFTWSGGFHGAGGTYLMQKQKDGWKVLIRDLFFYL